MTDTTKHLELMASGIGEILKEVNKLHACPAGLRKAVENAARRAKDARTWAASQGPRQRDLFGNATEQDGNPTPYSDTATSLEAAAGRAKSGRGRIDLFVVLGFLERRPWTNDQICVVLEGEDRNAGRKPRAYQSTVCSRLNAAEAKGFAYRKPAGTDSAKTRSGFPARRYHITPTGREALAEWRSKR